VLVYREQRQAITTRSWSRDIQSRLDELSTAPSDGQDQAVRTLIDLGVLEAGLADHLCHDEDEMHPLLAPFREASVAAGHLLYHTWRHSPEHIGGWIERARAAVRRGSHTELPGEVEASVPEGFAQYGLYPETYLVAAERLARVDQTPRVVCLGIRSIGTALSAVVAAALEELGRQVVSATLRPRGHPFDRRPRLGAGLTNLVRAHAGDLFVVVDEGPGLSGSSFIGVASTIETLGVCAERIVLLPSWHTDGASLNNAVARQRWRRYRQFSCSFEEVWRDSSRLQALVPDHELQDFSAGAWRRHLLAGQDGGAAIHPQHERRKFRALPARGGDRQPGLMLRFAGLGRYGDATRARAEALSDAGLAAPTRGLGHGFLLQDFRPGMPIELRNAPDLLATMAGYLAHLRQCRRASGPATDLVPMVRTNVAAALGPGEAELAIARHNGPLHDAEPTGLDGRMLPQEWLRSPSGWFKVDSLDHGDDHFFPGPQDIAWDVAGTCLEFGLCGSDRRALLAHYRRASGDLGISARLPSFAVAYLAYRFGYSSMAEEQLAGSVDGARFKRKAAEYRRALALELEPGGAERWRS
jgi:hypothetical protein